MKSAPLPLCTVRCVQQWWAKHKTQFVARAATHATPAHFSFVFWFLWFPCTIVNCAECVSARASDGLAWSMVDDGDIDTRLIWMRDVAGDTLYSINLLLFEWQIECTNFCRIKCKKEKKKTLLLLLIFFVLKIGAAMWFDLIWFIYLFFFRFAEEKFSFFLQIEYEISKFEPIQPNGNGSFSSFGIILKFH